VAIGLVEDKLPFTVVCCTEILHLKAASYFHSTGQTWWISSAELTDEPFCILRHGTCSGQH